MFQGKRFSVVLAVLVVLLSVGCISFNSEKKELLVSKQVSPTNEEQVVSTRNSSVSVRLPGGFLSTAQSLTISSLANPQEPFFAGYKSLGAYVIALGDDKNDSFQKEAILEFPYDPTTIPAGMKATDALAVAYLNKDTNSWVESPITVDETNHKVIVRTNHFSVWDLFGLLADYEPVPSPQGHFTVYYNKKYTFKCFGSEYGSEHLCAEGIGKVAELARAAYIEKSYLVPDKVNIYIEDIEESEMSKYTGNILLSKYMETLGKNATAEQGTQADNRVKHEVAHELFHVVENQYINVYTMGYRHWWMEAAADYAADKIAMHDGTMGMDIKPDCLKDSVYSEANQYNDAHFIDYLVEKGGLFFEEMFDYINTHKAGDAGETLILLKEYVDSEGPQYMKLTASAEQSAFEKAYSDYSAYYFFNSKSPIKIKTDLLTDTRSPEIDLRTTDETKEQAMPQMISYTTQLLAVKADIGTDPQRKISINPDQDLGTGLILAVYKASNNDPHTAQYVGSTKTKTSKVSADLGKDDVLYVLTVNTRRPGSGSSKEFNIVVTATIDKNKKTESFEYSKTQDLDQNPLTIKATGTITGPADMAFIEDAKPNILYITIANAKNKNTSITISANINSQPAKTHWEVTGQSDCPKVTKDVSNFQYKITTSEAQPVNPNPPKGYSPPLPKKTETKQTAGNIELKIPPEALQNGEYRIDIDLVWDWTNNYECREDSTAKSGPQSAKGGPGTNIIHIAVQ